MEAAYDATMTMENVEAVVAALNARSALYRLLSDGLAYPDRALADAITTGRYATEIAAHAAALPTLESESQDRSERCIAALRWLSERRKSLTLGELESQYGRVFGHALSRECPPYETEYVGTHLFMQSQEMADIGGFYRAFGLDVGAETHERLDYISVELEFLHVLTAREAFAWRNGREEQRNTCRDAQQRFVEEHLGRWALYFAGLLRNTATGTFYGALADVLGWFMALETDTLGTSPEWVSAIRPGDDASDAESASEESNALWVGDFSR